MNPTITKTEADKNGSASSSAVRASNICGVNHSSRGKQVSLTNLRQEELSDLFAEYEEKHKGKSNDHDQCLVKHPILFLLHKLFTTSYLPPDGGNTPFHSSKHSKLVATKSGTNLFYLIKLANMPCIIGIIVVVIIK